MRRKDREINDSQKIIEIIQSAYCCRLGLNDNGEVYIVPLSFGFDMQNDKMIFYFHCAKEGRKIDLIKKDNRVGFELDTGYQLNTSTTACGFSAKFQSIIGTGDIYFVENNQEKIYALDCIMKHYTQKDSWEYSAKYLDAVTILKLEINTLACKQHE